MKIPRSAVASVVEAILESGAVRATKYLDQKTVVSAQVRVFKKAKRQDHGHREILLKVGRPNYAERKFIKACEKAGERFPVPKVQLKFAK